MFDRESAIIYALEFINKLRQKGLHIRSVFLFGSFANGSERPSSDIDLAIVADEFTGFGWLDLGMMEEELIDYLDIHPKTYKTSYFQDGDPFIEEVIKSGIKLA